MTNQEILDFVARFHYVPLYVSTSPKSRKCGPGQEKWKQDLIALNDIERLSLSERIERCLKIIAKHHNDK